MKLEDLPAGLEAAIHAGEIDPEENGRSGYPALRDWVMGVTADPPDDAAAWVERREQLLDEALELASGLESLAQDGYFPPWWGSRWHRLLRMPWAEGFEEAVELARAENF